MAHGTIALIFRQKLPQDWHLSGCPAVASVSTGLSLD